MVKSREKPIAANVGNAAKMRETLLRCDAIAQLPEIREYIIVKEMRNLIKGALSAPPRNWDIMDWRTAWAKWRTECHPQKPCGYAEVVSGTEQFMDWYMSEAKGETK